MKNISQTNKCFFDHWLIEKYFENSLKINIYEQLIQQKNFVYQNIQNFTKII
jgi:hypothetical protein